MLGLIGKKIGMTRVFNEDGASVPVSVIQILPNKVTQIKTQDKEGYDAVQLTSGKRKASRVNKAAAGHFAKANVEAGDNLREFRVEPSEIETLQIGSELTVELFKDVANVDVTGVSKGKGFQGGVKRHNFSMQDATHGNSVSHRAIGSTGQNQTPGRVFKGKKMAGQMGNKQKTAENLEVVRADVERNLLLVKGSIPGAPKGKLIIAPSVKQSAVKAAQAA